MLSFNFNTGTLDFPGSGLANAALQFNFSRFRLNSTELSWHVKGDDFIAECNSSRVSFRLKTNENVLTLKVENNSETELLLENIKIIFPPSLDSADYIEYLHSRSFDKICGTRKVGLANRWYQGKIAGSMVYCLQNCRNEQAILLGASAPHAGDFITIEALHEKPHLEGNFGIEITSEQVRSIPPEGKAESSPLLFMLGKNALVLLEDYATGWAKRRSRPLKPRCNGWNSWDYYAGAVKPTDCFENMSEGRKNFGYIFKYVVIDEGWEPRWGNWEPNWKFQEGIENFCQRVEAENCIPGIWTAPLLVNTYTDIYREHPDWFGRDKDNNIVTKLYSYGPMAFLDPTQPEAAEFLRNIFVRLRHAGMKYFKVDFTQEILFCDRFHDMTLGRGGVIRHGFEIIREAIGDDAYLLSCGAPFESVTDIADSVRVTADVHNFWGHILANGGVMAARWWMSGKLFNVDPDFLIVRTAQTSPDPLLNSEYNPRPFDGKNWWLAGRELNLQEAKVYALSIYMNGGDIFLSDAIAKLNRTGIDLLKRIFEAPVITKSAVPLDLFQSHAEQAGTLVSHEEWGTAVCVFNWNDDKKLVNIVPDELNIEFSQAYDFWTREDEGKHNTYCFGLMPRSAKCILFYK